MRPPVCEKVLRMRSRTRITLSKASLVHQRMYTHAAPAGKCMKFASHHFSSRTYRVARNVPI